MLSFKERKFGDLSVVVYDFQFEGDILPMHEHTEDDTHISIVARGKIKAYGDGWERILSDGQIIDFVANQKHEIMALEDRTRIVNVLKKIKSI